MENLKTNYSEQDNNVINKKQLLAWLDMQVNNTKKSIEIRSFNDQIKTLSVDYIQIYSGIEILAKSLDIPLKEKEVEVNPFKKCYQYSFLYKDITFSQTSDKKLI